MDDKSRHFPAQLEQMCVDTHVNREVWIIRVMTNEPVTMSSHASSVSGLREISKQIHRIISLVDKLKDHMGYITRQTMYVQRDIDMRSLNHCRKRNEHYLFWVCVYRFSYPACKAHASHYIVICRLFQPHHIFPLYLTNGTIFWRKFLPFVHVKF